MDGVLVDTAREHFSAWRELCRRYGKALTKQGFRDTFGLRNREVIGLLFGKLDEEAIRVRSVEKEELFRAALRHVRALPGAIPLIEALRQEGYVQAIGSSAPRENIALLIERLALEQCFEVVIAEEDVKAGKPDPEVFLLAAHRLEVAPEHCLVIEDAVAGVVAAKAAGMACLAVTNTREREALSGADLVVDSLAEVELRSIEELVVGRRV